MNDALMTPEAGNRRNQIAEKFELQGEPHEATRGMKIPLSPHAIHSLAGILFFGRIHGYSLRKHIISRSNGMIQPAVGNFYVNLKTYEEEGLITSREAQEKQIQGPNRTREYEITEAGKAGLKAHLEYLSTTHDIISEAFAQDARRQQERIGRNVFIANKPFQTR